MHCSIDFFFDERWKTWHIHVYFTNSLTDWPQRHYDKKVPIKITWGQSVVATSQLLLAGPCIADVTIGQQPFTFWNRERWRIKCEFTSFKRQAPHQWLVHRIQSQKCLVGVVKGLPGTSISEEIADIFRNHKWWYHSSTMRWDGLLKSFLVEDLCCLWPRNPKGEMGLTLFCQNILVTAPEGLKW